jgi:hypothetical protein
MLVAPFLNKSSDYRLAFLRPRLGSSFNRDIKNPAVHFGMAVS